MQHRNAFALFDDSLTRVLNRSLSLRGVRPFFGVISCAGDGKAWYTIMVLLPLAAGYRGLWATCHMLAVACFTLPVYKITKSLTKRPRPCNANPDILRGTSQLDEFSFPSGHTMHAVAFALIAASWFPVLTVPLFVFAALIALSRIVLGLHYPTDVVLGAIVGFSFASLSFRLLAILQRSFEQLA